MIAHELGKSLEEVTSWTPSKIKGWITYFRLKNDLDNEAYERAKRKAGRG